MNRDLITIHETFTPEQTRELGRSLGLAALPGDVYCLDGELGTGKTVLAQGFAEGLGLREVVNSPTFTIIQTYESGRLPFYHMDVYRLSDGDELLAIGCEESFPKYLLTGSLSLPSGFVTGKNAKIRTFPPVPL